MKSKLYVPFILALLFACKASDDDESGTVPGNQVNRPKILQLVNDVRATGCDCGNKTMPPVPSVSWNKSLENAAFIHSKDMEENGYFSHIGQNGSTPGDRILEQDYQWTVYGENIANGQTSEEQVMDSWLNSPGHCENIMDPRFHEMGVGRSSNYWTQIFAFGK